MKKARHEAILTLIEKENIGTQEILLDRLIEEGFSVTQATISRDIKALRLIKTPTGDGEYKYVYVQKDSEDYTQKYYSILSHSVVSVNFAGNMAVVKCYTGMAQAACAALDSMHWEGLVGTLAGDDTIFALCRTPELANQMKEAIAELVG